MNKMIFGLMMMASSALALDHTSCKTLKVTNCYKFDDKECRKSYKYDEYMT